MTPGPLHLRVAAYRAEARDVVSLELRDAQGGSLPAFTPGSHLQVMIPGTHELIRHYSLCNSPAERHRYVIAVGLAADSRGGSRAVHEMVRCGTVLRSTLPRNNFPLVTDAGHFRFIAGGIGITPILSMIRWCAENAQSWSLLYCARSRLRAPFYEELCAFQDRVRFHFDDEAKGHPGDLDRQLSEPKPGEHAPLVFATLTAGIAQFGSGSALGRIGLRTMLWFVAAGVLSLVLGLVMVHLFEPGVGLELATTDGTAARMATSAGFDLRTFVTHIVPRSIFEAMADNQVLQIVVFSVVAGVALSQLGERVRHSCAASMPSPR